MFFFYHALAKVSATSVTLAPAGTLWIYGDSVGQRFVKSLRERGICQRHFKECKTSYMWIYEVFISFSIFATRKKSSENLDEKKTTELEGKWKGSHTGNLRKKKKIDFPKLLEKLTNSLR